MNGESATLTVRCRRNAGLFRIQGVRLLAMSSEVGAMFPNLMVTVHLDHTHIVDTQGIYSVDSRCNRTSVCVAATLIYGAGVIR